MEKNASYKGTRTIILMLSLLLVVAFLPVTSGAWVNVTSKGFSTASAGLNAQNGITSDGTNYWILDYTDKAIYHVDANGNNLTGSITSTQLSAIGCASPQDIAMNVSGNAIWVIDDVDRAVYSISLSGANQTGGFALGTAVSNPRGIGVNSSGSMFITDNSDNWCYHFINGVNQTNGWSCGNGDGQGIVQMNDGTYYVLNNQDLEHYTSNHLGIENISYLTLTSASANRGIATINGYDLTLSNTVSWVYYLSGNSLGVNLNSPINSNTTALRNITFNCSAQTTGQVAVSNVSLFHNIGGTFALNQTITYASPPSSANATFTINNIPYGSYLWNCRAEGNISGYKVFNSTNYSLSIFPFVENSITYNNATSKFSEETYTLNITGTASFVYLVYNGSRYLTTALADTYYKTLIIPSSAVGNQTFWFEITTPDGIFNSTFRNQTVNSWGIQDCNLYGGVPILNVSLKDEETNILLNKTAPNTTQIDIQLTLSNGGSSIVFNRTWFNNNTVAICLSNSTNSTYTINIIAGYIGSNHVKRFWYLDNGVFNEQSAWFNSYTPRVVDFMSLLTTDSTTFLFSFTDASGLVAPNDIVHVFRKYIGEGMFREVQRAKQDNNGQTHIHVVEEDVIYYFLITSEGNVIFTSDQYNAKCLSTPCSIDLTAQATNTNWSVFDNEGGKYQVSTNKVTRVVTTTFDLVGQIGLVNVSLYKFENGAYTIIDMSSLNATAGSISQNVPLAYGNVTFVVAIYRDNSFVKVVGVDLTDDAKFVFGTFGAILGGLIVLALLLMAVSEGAGVIVFLILALIVIWIMKLVDMSWVALGSLIFAGAIIVWKLINRSRRQQ